MVSDTTSSMRFGVGLEIDLTVASTVSASMTIPDSLLFGSPPE